ncbi:MAG: NlpC/P60 family protein [Bacteroidota bacterium]|nr:NlpC/P60 family protein [Bacteroidota bacterium]
MKNQFIFAFILICASSCSVFRPGTVTTNTASPDYTTASSGTTSQVKFINGISTGDNSYTGEKSAERVNRVISDSKAAEKIESRERFSGLQFKYAILTNTPVELLTNQKLLDFMDEWYGVPYHYGGTDKEGIDCSAFASLLMADVYQISDLPRMSRDQYKETRRIPKTHLREGDLVFFHTLGKGHAVTHVGVYLYNNRFIHASVSGVQISNLGEGYYASHFIGGGRVIPDLYGD